jgi:hypothetical protein
MKKEEEIKAKERFEEVKGMLCSFARYNLPDDIAVYSLKLWRDIASAKGAGIARGRSEIWAAAVIFCVCRLNFLFDSCQRTSLPEESIHSFFNCNPETVKNKAFQIEKNLDIVNADERYCGFEIVNEMEVVELPNGMPATRQMLRDMPGLFTVGLGEFKDYADIFCELTGMECEELKARIEENFREMPVAEKKKTGKSKRKYGTLEKSRT